MLRSLRTVVIAAGLLTLTLYFYTSLGYDYSLHSDPPRPLVIVKSSFDWSTLQLHHPVPSIKPLPSDPPKPLPRIQHEFSVLSRFGTPVREYRRRAVKKAFQKCWKNYKEQAWMRDELRPVSGGGKDTFGGWAATLIDSLDTLWIMGLHTDFDQAVDAVVTIDWSNTTSTALNIFETTIRHLGGLLSAYDLSSQPALLQKAVELGDMLYVGFDTPNHMPPHWLDFQKAKAGELEADSHQPVAVFGSLFLEFIRLSQLTGDPKYYDAVTRISTLLEKHQELTKLPGLWPTYVDLQQENFEYTQSFTIGALADSLYEYLPKTYALLGGLDSTYQKMYHAAAETIQTHLLFQPMTPDNSDILFSGTRHMGDLARLDAEGEHLACFAGGMFALAGRIFGNDSHVETGERLARGCAWAYKVFPTGIMPENFEMVPCKALDNCVWDEQRWKNKGGGPLPQGFIRARDRSYFLRPEAIESVFILYRITGKEEFQEVAWRMFQSVQKATETEYGNSAIDDVTTGGLTEKKDSMESFWLAETLKYFYLIFSPPDLISLDEYVFNTEAHPFRLPR